MRGKKLPRVIVYNAVSLDGRIDWFAADLGQFYGLVPTWGEDATLAGSETIVKAGEGAPEEEGSFDAPETVPGDTRPLLVIVDSRGRVRKWQTWRKAGYWRDVAALVSEATPKEYLDYLDKRHVDYIVSGKDRVDLRSALEALASRYGVKTVRVESGGTLNGVLLRAGLVDEVSLLIHPSLVGGMTLRSFFRAADLTSSDGVIPLRLIDMKRLDGDLVWLKYECVR
ncbi:MAG: RibD family protein [Bacillota bacterium]